MASIEDLRKFWDWCVAIEKPQQFTALHLAAYLDLMREKNVAYMERLEEKKAVLGEMFQKLWDHAALCLPQGTSELATFRPDFVSALHANLDQMDDLAQIWLYAETTDSTGLESTKFYTLYQQTWVMCASQISS